MAYKQPRVPLLREGGNLYQFVKELVRFLVDFSVSAWNADRLKDEELKAIKQQLDQSQAGGLTIDNVYPVGSIYMSVQATSPETLFGGTWERLKDRFLLGAGDLYAAGSAGGEAAHALTVDEMPEHDHGMSGHVFSWGNGVDDTVYAPVSAAAGTVTNNYLYTLQGEWNKTEKIGGGAAHNNMPPYLSVYMWQRTG